MAYLTAALILLLHWLGQSTCLAQDSQNPLGIPPFRHKLRPVIYDDLDDLATTYYDAFSPGPTWQYLYLDDSRYGNYTRACTRATIDEQFKHLNRSRTTVNVITVPHDRAGKHERRERVVSFAVWNWIYPGENVSLAAPPTPTVWHSWLRYDENSDCAQHLDTNMTRLQDLLRQSERKTDPTYNSTEPQLYLSLLATHPDWDGHGFGAEQVELGIQKAAIEEAPVTLLATPAGYPLYDSLGFLSLENVPFTMLDDLGVLWFERMRKAVDLRKI